MIAICLCIILTNLSQVHKLHLESGMKTATFHTECLMFLALELKKNYWIVSILPLHLLPVVHLVMPLYSAREVFNDKQNSASSYSILFLFFYVLASFSNPANCTDGELRLFGGSSSFEGRVEICANKAGGTVCVHSTWRVSNVVCRQLGHSVIGKDCRRESKATSI